MADLGSLLPLSLIIPGSLGFLSELGGRGLAPIDLPEMTGVGSH